MDPIERVTSNRTGTESVTNRQEASPVILLVEDEARVRRVMEEVLQVNGYPVQVFWDAEEAMEEIGRQRVHPRLLITDIVLPGRTGRELAREVRSRIPGIKTILVSGYGENLACMAVETAKDVSYLAKPFSVSQLVGAVREALKQDLAEKEECASRACELSPNCVA